MDALAATLSFTLLYGVSYGLLLFIIAIGLVVTMGLMRIVNMAHGAFAAVGGYLAHWLIGAWGMPFWGGVVVAVLAVAALGAAMERVLYVRLYGAPELDQLLMTIGLCFGTIGLLTLVFGPNVYPSATPAMLAGNVDILGRPFPAYRVFVFLLGALVVVLLWLLFERTLFGARLRAAVDNRGMAQAAGVDVDRLFSVAFAVGAGLAALGGAVGAPMLPLDPLYPFKYLPLFLIIVGLAGFGHIRASFWVAILVGLVDTAGRFLAPEFGGFTVYVLLIALLLWRPNGLLGALR
jgi:branched-chain amino acid transport system permease protein